MKETPWRLSLGRVRGSEQPFWRLDVYRWAYDNGRGQRKGRDVHLVLDLTDEQFSDFLSSAVVEDVKCAQATGVLTKCPNCRAILAGPGMADDFCSLCRPLGEE